MMMLKFHERINCAAGRLLRAASCFEQSRHLCILPCALRKAKSRYSPMTVAANRPQDHVFLLKNPHVPEASAGKRQELKT
jgi:hypothetical protein